MVPLFFLTYQTLNNFDESALHRVASHVDVLRASSRIPSFLLWGGGGGGGEGKERVADPQERLSGRLCMEGGPYKFKTRFYFRQFEHFLQPLLLTSKCFLLTII